MKRPLFDEFVKRVNSKDYVFKSVAMNPFDVEEDEQNIKEGKFVEDSLSVAEKEAREEL